MDETARSRKLQGRHLQHPPLPRSRRADAPAADRRGPRDHRRRHHRAAGSDRRQPAEARAGRGDRRRAGHGLGDGADSSSAQRALRQCRPQPASRCGITTVRPELEDVRARGCAARRSGRLATMKSSTSTTCISGRRCSSGANRRRSWRHLVHDRRVVGPKIVLGDFNEWARALAKDVLAERLQSIDLTKHLRRRRTYPGFFPVVHLDHIYYEGARSRSTRSGCRRIGWR